MELGLPGAVQAGRGLCIARNAAKPEFVATAVLSLAHGIGANTAIFRLIDALLLRWLPVHEPQQLLQLKMYPGGKRDTRADTYRAKGSLCGTVRF